MDQHVNSIANRLSLRRPQRDSLEILDRVCEIISLEKDVDLSATQQIIQSEFPTVTNFEHNFPSMCFAIATGVGKTRLMGAFISYLHLAKGIRHFFVLAPNLTIYNKLIADFTPNTPKYVFQGISEFAVTPPEIITGENYESGLGVRDEASIQKRLFSTSDIHINIFNISKINAEVRSGKVPRIKRLSEYIGESYFEYLSKLDDLVLLMDESHRYRASAGVKAINELQPILGLELTATPQVERAVSTEPFRNIIYSYPLSNAMQDGFVKEPAVATRENFNPKNYTTEQLEKIKLEDGIRVHEYTKVELEVYARESQRELVKPFMLIVAQDTNHADILRSTIENDAFFEGKYKGKVITVHSNLKGEERDETVEQLITVEQSNNPTEIVIHVNMLKEGWDVTNLYTIVPLRAANSKTLVEQSIGRGLRLPYGKRVGVASIDRLTIVSHDKFQEIIDDANRPDSLIRAGVIIGKDIPNQKETLIVVVSEIDQKIASIINEDGLASDENARIVNAAKRKIAKEVLEAIKDYEDLPSSQALKTEEIQKEIEKRVIASVKSTESQDDEKNETVKSIDTGKVILETVELYIALTIDIPRLIVIPKGNIKGGFQDFNLDVSNISVQPVENTVLIQHLQDQSRYRVVNDEIFLDEEERPEDYLVQSLTDFDDISYDNNASLLYKLASQLVEYLQSYLKDTQKIKNVLQYHQRQLVDLIHTQMQDHYEENITSYDVQVSKGFTTLRPVSYSSPANEAPRNFRVPVDEKLMIRGMLFNGFERCLYPIQKFDSDPERRFAVLLENDEEVIKWVKPAKGSFQIHYANDNSYEPDFVVETKTTKYLCEPKQANKIDDREVLAKADAAVIWCQHATSHERVNEGKPWLYLLIPHDAIIDSMTLRGLASIYNYTKMDTSKP